VAVLASFTGFPLLAAGINPNLCENKVESMMRQAAIHKKDALVEPIVRKLWIRLNEIIVLNEKDCKDRGKHMA
jgi:hypothetical protein